MRSTDDLSTPARIRASAIRVFARDGFSAGIRQIAAEAGVTAGLVMHHFGSKNGLRSACDAHVVDALLGPKADGTASATTLAAHFAQEGDADAPPLAAYLRRMLAEPSPEADDLFDRLSDGTRATLAAQQQAGVIRADLDIAAVAPLIALYGLAPVVLPELLARAVGRHDVDAHTLSAAAEAMAPLLTHGLYESR